MKTKGIDIGGVAVAALCFACAIGSAQAQAQELTAGDIVEKANQTAYYAGKDGRSDVRMTIVDASGQQRARQFRVLRLTMPNGRDQKFYVYFNEPADVRRMAYLVWKKVDADDDRWLWLPALNLVRRIAPGDKRTSFVGSDFVYEDVSGRGIREDKHEIVEVTDTQYVLKHTPRDPASVEFAHYKVWIDKDTFLPRKAEYVDKSGALFRRVEAERVETIQGFPTVTLSVATDLKTGSSTRNEFTDVKYDIGLNENIFSERFLRRPPREATQ